MSKRLIPTGMLCLYFLIFSWMCFLSSASAETRALLVACSDFMSQPNLGASISGNLHMIGSALVSAQLSLGNLSIEDGTIGTRQNLQSAVDRSFSDVQDQDLSIFYLCTHGIPSLEGDRQVTLLLGNGKEETSIQAQDLYDLFHPLAGQKLLIIDACHSGALIGRGATCPISDLPESLSTFHTPFFDDPTLHVLTSASGGESSWYYDSQKLNSGAVSYFASALSVGIGLYGDPEADLNFDGIVSLEELFHYLRMAVPSSSCELLSISASSLEVPVATNAALLRPLSGFSYDSSLIPADDPVLDFAFTVSNSDTRVQYRLVEFINGNWDWDNSRIFFDEGDTEDALLTPGRKQRSLFLDGLTPKDGGYLMLQVFSVSNHDMLLCSERLIAIQPQNQKIQMRIASPDSCPDHLERSIEVFINVPAKITVSVLDKNGTLISRPASGQLTRPSMDCISHFYWNGLDQCGHRVPDGIYTLIAEAYVGTKRHRVQQTIHMESL